jgi:hypothetical protein
MLPTSQERALAKLVAELVHKDKKLDAAKAVNDFCRLGLKLDDDNPEKFLPVLQHYLHFLLNNGAPEEAAQILWTPNKFTPEPQFTKDLWKLFDDSSMGIIMGGASCSKSYGLGGVRFMLEWIRDPANTSVRIIGPSEDHLESNLFSHLVDLHRCSSLPLPGKVGELFIGLDRRNQLSAIKGVVIPVGNNKKSGRIQGAKRKARMTPHPVFGALSRLFIFIDEIENVPGGIWGDVDNVVSNIQEEGDTAGFKIFVAYNPKDITNTVAERAEPEKGWGEFNVEEDYRWKSKRGWDVLRLDGERCENVVQNRVVYPGLQTRAGLNVISRNAGGIQSAGYFSMGRGAYPPLGIELQIIPSGMLPKMRGEFIWYDKPKPVASCDLALEGGDAAPYTLGKWGLATGIKYPPSIEHPEGHKAMFKDRSGNVIQRWGLQIEQQFTVPKGDTFAMKKALIELNRKAGVRGEFFCVDRTGVGSGVADLLKHEWSTSIHDVNFSEAASSGKVMVEDTKNCDEEYERMNSELWFVMRAWGEFQYLLIVPWFDSDAWTKVSPQLTNRKFRTSGGKSRAESKKEYMSRNNNQSPNEADGFTLIVHAARKGSGVTLSMSIDQTSDVPGNEDDDWDSHNYPGGAKLDVSNRTDYLDDRM